MVYFLTIMLVLYCHVLTSTASDVATANSIVLVVSPTTSTSTYSSRYKEGLELALSSEHINTIPLSTSSTFPTAKSKNSFVIVLCSGWESELNVSASESIAGDGNTLFLLSSQARPRSSTAIARNLRSLGNVITMVPTLHDEVTFMLRHILEGEGVMTKPMKIAIVWSQPFEDLKSHVVSLLNVLRMNGLVSYYNNETDSSAVSEATAMSIVTLEVSHVLLFVNDTEWAQEFMSFLKKYDNNKSIVVMSASSLLSSVDGLEVSYPVMAPMAGSTDFAIQRYLTLSSLSLSVEESMYRLEGYLAGLFISALTERHRLSSSMMKLIDTLHKNVFFMTVHDVYFGPFGRGDGPPCEEGHETERSCTCNQGTQRMSLHKVVLTSSKFHLSPIVPEAPMFGFGCFATVAWLPRVCGLALVVDEHTASSSSSLNIWNQTLGQSSISPHCTSMSLQEQSLLSRGIASIDLSTEGSFYQQRNGCTALTFAGLTSGGVGPSLLGSRTFDEATGDRCRVFIFPTLEQELFALISDFVQFEHISDGYHHVHILLHDSISRAVADEIETSVADILQTLSRDEKEYAAISTEVAMFSTPTDAVHLLGIHDDDEIECVIVLGWSAMETSSAVEVLSMGSRNRRIGILLSEAAARWDDVVVSLISSNSESIIFPFMAQELWSTKTSTSDVMNKFKTSDIGRSTNNNPTYFFSFVIRNVLEHVLRFARSDEVGDMTNALYSIRTVPIARDLLLGPFEEGTCVIGVKSLYTFTLNNVLLFNSDTTATSARTRVTFPRCGVAYTRLTHKIETSTWILFVIAVFATMFIAVFSYWLRLHHHEQHIHLQSELATQYCPKDSDVPFCTLFIALKQEPALWDAHPSTMPKILEAYDSVLKARLKKYAVYHVKYVGSAAMIVSRDSKELLLFAVDICKHFEDVDWRSIVNNNKNVDHDLMNDNNFSSSELLSSMGSIARRSVLLGTSGSLDAQILSIPGPQFNISRELSTSLHDSPSASDLLRAATSVSSRMITFLSSNVTVSHSFGLHFETGTILHLEERGVYDYIGKCVDVAAAVADLAHGFQILATASVVNAAELSHEYTRHYATTQLSGLSQKETDLFQILSPMIPDRTFKYDPPRPGSSQDDNLIDEKESDGQKNKLNLQVVAGLSASSSDRPPAEPSGDSVASALKQQQKGLVKKRVTVLSAYVGLQTDEQTYEHTLVRLCSLLSDSRGYLHSYICGRIIVSFNAVFPASQAAAKAHALALDLIELFGPSATTHPITVGISSQNTYVGNFLVRMAGGADEERVRHQALISDAAETATWLQQQAARCVTKSVPTPQPTPSSSATSASFQNMIVVPSSLKNELSTSAQLECVDVVRMPIFLTSPNNSKETISGLYALRSIRTSSNAEPDEWMYELEDGDKANPYKDLNNLFADVMSGVKMSVVSKKFDEIVMAKSKRMASSTSSLVSSVATSNAMNVMKSIIKEGSVEAYLSLK